MACTPTPCCSEVTLDHKVGAIRLKDEGKYSKQNASDSELQCGPTQINSSKRKDKYECQTNPSSVKRIRKNKTANEEIYELTWTFFQDCAKCDINCTGPMLQEKALEYAKDLGVSDFKATNAWLEDFQKRHGLTGRSTVKQTGAINV